MTNPSGSYDPVYFAPLYEIEDRHFWFRGRNPLISAIVRQLTGGLPSCGRVLEVGCGTGSVLRGLEEACSPGAVVGMDLFDEGLRFARKRVTCGLVQADVFCPPFGPTFDVIGLFDVLEHLPDDLGVLRGLHALLKPGGRLVLTVPASRSLWSYFDEASHHARRYEQVELRLRLGEAGFQVEYLSPYMMTIFPLVWLNRRLAKVLPGDAGGQARRSDALAERELQIIPVVNEILAWILSQEARLVLKRRQLPLGTSLIAIARK